MTERNITIHELARRLALSSRTVYRHVQSGLIPGEKRGSSWWFDFDEVIAALEKDAETQREAER